MRCRLAECCTQHTICYHRSQDHLRCTGSGPSLNLREPLIWREGFQRSSGTDFAPAPPVGTFHSVKEAWSGQSPTVCRSTCFFIALKRMSNSTVFFLAGRASAGARPAARMLRVESLSLAVRFLQSAVQQGLSVGAPRGEPKKYAKCAQAGQQTGRHLLHERCFCRQPKTPCDILRSWLGVRAFGVLVRARAYSSRLRGSRGHLLNAACAEVCFAAKRLRRARLSADALQLSGSVFVRLRGAGRRVAESLRGRVFLLKELSPRVGQGVLRNPPGYQVGGSSICPFARIDGVCEFVQEMCLFRSSSVARGEQWAVHNPESVRPQNSKPHVLHCPSVPKACGLRCHHLRFLHPTMLGPQIFGKCSAGHRDICRSLLSRGCPRSTPSTQHKALCPLLLRRHLEPRHSKACASQSKSQSQPP